jgi:hypothetical protein
MLTPEYSIALVKKKASYLEKMSGKIGKMVSRKMKSVLDKNSVMKHYAAFFEF